MTQVNSRIATIENDQAKADYAVVEGFCSGFGKYFRNAFDKKYYEQLWEETFQYRRVTPRSYIVHLETRWVKMDTNVIARLRSRFLR